MNFTVSRRELLVGSTSFLVAGCGPEDGQGSVDPVPTPTPSVSYAKTVTVGATGQFASLADAAASLTDGTASARQLIRLLPGSDPTKLAVPLFTDLTGESASVSRINFAGSATLTDSTRVQYDPVLLRGDHTLSKLSITTRNSNYCVHSETAGVIADWTQRIEDCLLRHDGNEEPWRGGALSVAGTWIPAIGAGVSSGSSLTINRVTATSLKGGGVYFHNSVQQAKPCAITISNSSIGGDDPVSPDIVINPIGSGTRDAVTLDNLSLSNGIIRYVCSWQPRDPAKNFAMHNEFAVTLTRTPNAIFMVSDSGRALRIDSLTMGVGSVIVEGDALPLIFGTSTNVSGEAGLSAYCYGSLDISTNYGAVFSLGARLGDCSVLNRTLRVIGDGSSVEVRFAADYSNTSNADILSFINSAIASMATAYEWDIGNGYRPSVPEQELKLRNSGSAAIQQGAAIVYADGATCRVAGPSDVVGGILAAGLKIGVSLEEIKIGAIGRVQASGRINAEWLRTNATSPNLGDGYIFGTSASGVQGFAIYAGSQSSVLRCVRAAMLDGYGRYAPAILEIG